MTRAEETYALYCRAMATGDVDLLRGRVSKFIKAEVERTSSGRTRGSLVTDFVIHPELSAPPKIITVRPAGSERGAMAQVVVRFRTTQSLTVIDKRGQPRPDLSSNRVPVMQYFVFQRPCDIDGKVTADDWEMAVEAFEPASPIARPRSEDAESISAELEDAPIVIDSPISAWTTTLADRFYRWRYPSSRNVTA